MPRQPDSELVAGLFAERRTILRAGRAAEAITLDPEHLTVLVRRHLVTATGLDPATIDDALPPMLWDDGTSRLVVHLADTAVRCGDGLVDVTLNVECDQTGVVQVVATFVTASPNRPGGFVWATQDAPRGPQPVVQVWGDALVALGWRVLVEVAAEVAGTVGVDQWGRGAIAATVVASREGLTVRPTAAPRFMKVGRS